MRMISLVFLLFIVWPVSLFADNSYEIDPEHSSVIFKVKHLGISTVTGSFGTFSGSLSYDPKNVAASKTEAKISTASVDTANEKRDKHLRDTDFFNVAKFPEMTFVSKKISEIDGDSFTLTGDLTLLGITKEVDLKTEFTGQAVDPWGFERVAFEAHGKLDRKEYGMTFNKVLDAGGFMLGNEVKILIELEAKRKKG